MTERLFKYWLAAFALSSFTYLLVRHFNWLPSMDWAPKIIPILLLITYAAMSIQGRVRNLLLIGLSFSLLGDILLSLNGLFIHGLGAFLIAQLTYAALFISQARISTSGFTFASIMVLLVGIAAWQILPQTADLKWVVLAYMIAITTMAISAGFRNDPAFLFTAIGAAIFVLSDTIIAINKFIAPFEWAGIGIMVTYYLAQLMITLGVCRHSILQMREPHNASA
ncbi:MAG: lysoplasmalogenase [Gammaproteobacteria bacterium]|nr:lysoplasmalogenase [Gammaproteobacteria bacterium]